MMSDREYWEFAERVIDVVEDEIMRQYAIYPNPEKPVIWTSILTEELGEIARAQLRNEDANYRKELIQLAAASLRAVVDLDNGMTTEYLWYQKKR